MNVLMIGINHKTAPIEIRERLYLKEVERGILLSELKSDPSIVEAIVLSTCNRTEVYVNTVIENSAGFLIDALLKLKNLPHDSEFRQHLYTYSGQEAIGHLLRVASGLDSLVLGEKQILGQVKSAIELSRRKNMMGKYFNILSDVAVRAGKKAQNETEIGFGGASVSWAAVATAQKELGTLKDKSVLIIGAGKMGNLAASHVKNKGTGHIYVINRSKQKADVLAEKFGGTAVSFWEIKEVLSSVDICICSAGAPHYLVEKELVEQVMSARADKKLVCVDISIPRNIDPAVASLHNVSLITIDDLDVVVEKNIEKRHLAIDQVEHIIARKIEEFYSKIHRNRAVEEFGFRTFVGIK